MKLSTFILLSEKEKQHTLMHEGILVAKRNNTENLIFLFQLEGFYVEVYGNINNKKVEEFRTFSGTEQLHPYLESINIAHLL